MNINATLLAQAVVMIVFVAICWKYIYPPILSVMKEREKRISDGLEAAKKADDSLEEAKLAFDKELDQAKAEAAEILEKANARASQIVSDASSKAEAEAEKILTSASTTIENYMKIVCFRFRSKCLHLLASGWPLGCLRPAPGLPPACSRAASGF